jgi:Na+/H+ antiporter NhaD/arsenite permease-like protein
MPNPELALNANMYIAGATLILAYILIFSEVIHRTSAAIIGAVVMVGVGMFRGFYTQEQALVAVDGNTILLLTGMMMIVVMLRPTGGFEYLAIRIAKLSQGDPRRLLVYLGAAVSLVTMFLDNVTTVLIFAPLTVLITRILGINPLPYLFAEAMLSNIGGIATLVGDPPNIIIGSAGSIDFTTFLVHMFPPVLVIWLGTVVVILFMFRSYLEPTDKNLLDLDESKAITDKAGLVKGMIALCITVLLFFVHHRFHFYPAYVAFIGVAIAAALLRPDPEPVFGKVEWSVLFFFAGLFVIVGGVEASGLLDLIGHRFAEVAQDPSQLMITGVLLMWAAAILSAVVDNIPFTVTMTPIIVGLESQGVNITPLWWALALGVGLGGNGSHIGATANVICVAESERCGIPEARITPLMWLRIGMPTMIFGLILATVLYISFFSFFT